MIALTKYIIATGEIFGRIAVANQEDAMLNTFSLEPGEALIEGEFFGETHYILDDVATPRPALALPIVHSLPAGSDWEIPGVPEGTVVVINKEEVGTVDETGLVLSFDLAREWQVELRPPFPWLEASCGVTVT